MNQNSIFKDLESLSKIRQREVYCHIAKVTAINTPLVASDDLMLKTTMSSVGTYDRELSKIIFKHTSFPDIESQGQKINFDQFIDNLSYLDRQVLLWGIFDSTYGSLGERDIQCPHCQNVFRDDVKSEELLQSDSLIAWEHEQSFKEYICDIPVMVENDAIHRIVFSTKLPTIKDHLDTIGLLAEDVIQSNYEQFGALFSKVEELTSVTSAVKIYKTEDSDEPEVITAKGDIYFIISNYILLSMTTDTLKQFNDHFVKYIPNFRKPYNCGECGKDFDFFVDIEISLFRRFLETD